MLALIDWNDKMKNKTASSRYAAEVPPQIRHVKR